MFVLQPKPTFKLSVAIPRLDDEDATIEFEFNHKDRKGLKAYFDSLGEGETARKDVDALGELVKGWSGVDVKYSSEALGTLFDNFPGAPVAILEAYTKALAEGKRKNS